MEQLQLSLQEPRPKRRQRSKRRRSEQPKDGAFAAAMRDAREILQWRVGPNVPEWRVYRLAMALCEQAKAE